MLLKNILLSLALCLLLSLSLKAPQAHRGSPKSLTRPVAEVAAPDQQIKDFSGDTALQLVDYRHR